MQQYHQWFLKLLLTPEAAAKGGEHTIALSAKVLNITEDLIARGTSVRHGTLTSDRCKPVGRVRSSRSGASCGGGGDKEKEAESHEKGKDRKGRHDEVPSTRTRSKRMWNLSTENLVSLVCFVVRSVGGALRGRYTKGGSRRADATFRLGARNTNFVSLNDGRIKGNLREVNRNEGQFEWSVVNRSKCEVVGSRYEFIGSRREKVRVLCRCE